MASLPPFGNSRPLHFTVLTINSHAELTQGFGFLACSALCVSVNLLTMEAYDGRALLDQARGPTSIPNTGIESHHSNDSPPGLSLRRILVERDLLESQTLKQTADG